MSREPSVIYPCGCGRIYCASHRPSYLPDAELAEPGVSAAVLRALPRYLIVLPASEGPYVKWSDIEAALRGGSSV